MLVNRKELIMGLLSAVAIAIVVTFALVELMNRAFPPQKPSIRVIAGEGVTKSAAHAWQPLEQVEIDKLAEILGKRRSREVSIFCGGSYCDDLALDFDDAFGTAHWESAIERPASDANVGISVGPNDDDGKALADAILIATGGRLSPKLIGANLLGHHPGTSDPAPRLALVISKKPK
jgi:hypothetical protein